MKLTLLGTGTCASDFPHIENRYPPGFLLETQDTKILIECSEGIRFRLQKINTKFDEIEHIIISHSHPDHCALFHFIQSVFVNKLWKEESNKEKTINIYCPNHIAENYQSIWQFYVPEMEGKPWPFPKIKLHPMSSTDNSDVTIADKIKIKAFPVYHGFGKVDCLAFRIESRNKVFTFSGDTGICDNICKASKNADLFLCEIGGRIGDFEISKTYGHLNPFQAGEIAQKSKVKKLTFFHISGLDSNENIIKDCRKSGYLGEVEISQDFSEIHF
jgi:ribonuclease BN (tRNA processing enzyme)